MRKIAWASISEKGTVNGKKGNQTGRELKIGKYYDFGQDMVIRYKNPNRGAKAAKVAKLLCTCNKIGYGQSDRDTLFKACKSYQWNYKKIHKAIVNGTFPKCNCDCSSLCTVITNIVYGKEKIPAWVNTSFMRTEYVQENPKCFKLIWLKSYKKLQKKGDMVLNAGKHVVITL